MSLVNIPSWILCSTVCASNSVSSERMATTAEVTDRITLTAAAEFACYPPSKEQPCWAIASLRAPFYEPTSRSPVDIAAVIDKSGSMRGKKLDLVKKTLLFVIDQCECLFVQFRLLPVWVGLLQWPKYLMMFYCRDPN